ncbi:MAG: transglycosylase domain-containing protein [Lachnospiraceae bacterium]
MNYGKNGIAKEERRLSAQGTKVQKKMHVLLLKLFVFLALCLFVGLFCAGIGVFRGIIDSAPDIDSIDATPTGYLSTVLDTDKKQIAKLVASGSNRIYVTIDEIPLNLQHAFVAIEDARFYEHNGIDVKGILRAGMIGLSQGHFSEGASTLTQQLLKNNVFTNWTTQTALVDKMQRKIQEQYLAIQLEKTKSKDWIMENYLNTINLGQNTLGVQAASHRYFQKDVSDLNLSECAVIAGITQNPARYNPVSNPKENAKRRKKVLKNMYEQGYITKKDYKKALKDDVYSRIQLVNAELADDNVTSYFVDELTEQVVEDLVSQKGYSKTQAYKALYNGGLTIYSTQDSNIQKICDEEASNPANYDAAPLYSFSYRLSVKKKDGSVKNYDENTLLNYYRTANPDYTLLYPDEAAAADAIAQYKAAVIEKGDQEVPNSEVIQYTLQPQTALTIIDQKTGDVKAIVGGRGEKTASKTLNRASNTTRQPGSTFKILASYAPALDTGKMTLATVQDDAPYTYSNGTPLRNYDNHYRGFTTLREAITNSINVVTVKTLSDIGVDTSFDYLKKFGFTSLTDADRVESLCLGGLTNGVTNLELTAAYAAIADEGVYIKPRFYTKVVDHNGQVLLKNKVTKHRVLKKTTSFLLTSAMQDVVKKGTGTLVDFGTMPIAGKTGTTTKNRDALFAGFTPYYTCVVWGGYDDNSELTSTAYPKLIWKAVMQRIHENLPQKEFQKPDGIVTRKVCKKSGKLAISGVCDCDPRGSMVEKEYFAKGTQPKDDCDHHINVTICTASGMLAGEYCPAKDLHTSVYITGGSPDTDDGPYLFNGDSSDKTCNVHTEDWKNQKIQEKQEKQDKQKKKKKKNSTKNDSANETNWILPGPPLDNP